MLLSLSHSFTFDPQTQKWGAQRLQALWAAALGPRDADAYP